MFGLLTSTKKRLQDRSANWVCLMIKHDCSYGDGGERERHLIRYF